MSAPVTYKWDLESLFTAEDFLTIIRQIGESVTRLKQDMYVLSVADLLNSLQELGGLIEEVDMFLYALRIDNSEHDLIHTNVHLVQNFKADFASLQVQFEQRINEISEDEWFSILRDPIVEPIAYLLDDRRRQITDRLPPDQEQLVNRLSTNGYHAWGMLRHKHVETMTFSMNNQELTMGQIFGLLNHSDRQTRYQASICINQSFKKDAELFAHILNSLSGYRLDMYTARGWDSVLQEPMQQNHVSQTTIDTMFNVLEQYIPKFVLFIDKKAQLMGLKQLSYFDMTVPLFEANSEVTFERASELIPQHFGRFSTDMAKLASQAFNQHWIDSQESPRKANGGVCVPFPLAKQSRISVNYRGKMNDLFVLAHELGHAYHNETINDLPYFARQYPMSVAETASTLAENILINSLIDSADSKKERLGLISEKLHRTIPFALLGAFSGYLFEKSFYEERKRGYVSPERITELSIQAQNHVYLGGMDQYNAYQWAIQPHFYMTDVPFYNFPYTFGYLFSIGIYSNIQEGSVSENDYRELLRNTGRMSVEDLAEQFLAENITGVKFWETALDAIKNDINAFLNLTD